MKRKYLLSLLTVALVIPCVVVLAACGGVNAGFSSQTALAKAYVKMQGQQIMLQYGEGPSLNDMIRFSYEAQFMGGVMGIMNDVFDAAMKEQKANHTAMWNGSWAEEWNKDGTVKETMSTEDRDAYRELYRDTKAMAGSFKMLTGTNKTGVNAAATEAASANPAAYVDDAIPVGRIQRIEVWTVMWEYTVFIEGEAQADKGQGATELVLVRIGGKWYDAEAGVELPPLPTLP